jgi:hypothetical protein
MANGMFLAWTSPASPEVEDELNKWYDEIHIPQVRAAIPAISAARRFKVHGPANGPSRYLCIYELEGDDLDSAAAALGAASSSGQLDMTTTMNVDTAPPEIVYLAPLS